MKNRNYIFLFIFLGIGIYFLFQSYQKNHWQDFKFINLETFKNKKKSLKVLTYSSFAGVYGPGRIIKKQFEAFCDCKVQWFLAEDSTALWQRFVLIPEVDVVIGWDQITLQSAGTLNWEDLSKLKNNLLKKSSSQLKPDESFFQNPYFLPLDWSPIGFIRRENKQSLFSLKTLYKISGKLSFPEPRTSSLGLQFYYWIYELFEGDQKEIESFLKKLKAKVYGPVFSWSLAYGFFQKGQSDRGLSYLSSLIYHQTEEPNKTYLFSPFKEGHPYQVEFLSISKTSENKQLALKFAEFLFSKDIQNLIMNTNYMFPVSQEIPSHSLLNLKSLKLISYKRLNEFIKKKKVLLQLWEQSLYE